MELSHIDKHGRARMVDISDKPETRRLAVASGMVTMQPETVALIERQGIAKGDVFAVARVAAILAAKGTAGLIPMCHPLLLTDVRVDLRSVPTGIAIEATVATTGRTGAEMEALTAVSVAALTIYDMCKAVDRSMTLTEIRLIHKEGGVKTAPGSRLPAPGEGRGFASDHELPPSPVGSREPGAGSGERSEP
jgi:cyclic pyranopterin phosphate synthase